MFWSIAAASSLTGGVGQPAAVLPSLLAALAVLAGTAATAWLLAGRRDREVPVLAAGLLAVAFTFLNLATRGQLDMLLTAGTTWGFFLLLRGAALHPSGERRPGDVTLAFALFGLATLAKGPVGLIVPAGGVLLGAWLARRPVPWRELLRWAPWAAYAAVVGAWLVPAALHALASGQEAWLSEILFRQTVVRYTESWHHAQPLWYFLLVPWYDFLPTVLLLPAALAGLFARASRTARPRPLSWLLAGAGLFAVLFFSIPAGKRGIYLAPAYPWAAAWFATDLLMRIRAGGRALRPVRAAFGALAALGFGLGVAAELRLPAALAARGIDLPRHAAALALGLVGLAALAVAIRPASRRALVAVGLAFALLYGLAVRVAMPALDVRNSVAPFVQAARAALIDGARGGMVEWRAQYSFYAGPLDEALPGNEAELAALAGRLGGDAPYFVIVSEKRAPGLLRRVTGKPPIEAVRGRIGNDTMLVLANRAALGPAAETLR
jgi:4-amino-4-deoxy-L-arabinose transferase-like glycosyltransferase